MEFYEIFRDQLSASLNQFLDTVSNFLPNLLMAIALLLLGLVLAWFAKWLIFRLGAGIDRMVKIIGFSSLRVQLKNTLGYYLGWIVYWIIVAFFVVAAVESLGLPILAQWLSRLIAYLPNLFAAVLFIFGGIYFGNIIRDKTITGGRSAGLQRTDTLGSLLRTIIILLAVIVGLTQIGLDVELLENTLTIIVAAFALAVAFAFGLGAGPTVANIISSRYVRKTYQIGQIVHIDSVQGKILELSSTGVVLETDTGRTFIPAKLFDEKVSVLLDDEILDDT